MQRKIIHIDMDCFYAAVETKHHPHLKGHPLGIGGTGPRSVLCTANYEARKYGVRAAMPTALAKSLCPSLKIIHPHFELYKEESLAIREIFRRFTDKVEPLSLDEAYLDVTGSTQFSGSATLIAQEIRNLIFKERQLTASAGVAPNKFLAKIASDWRKPNGIFVIRPEDVPSFVYKLPVEKIHGVGKVTSQKLHSKGLLTCGDIQKRTLAELSKDFGSRAEDLLRMAQGIDERKICTEWERKSLSVEETFRQDRKTLEDLRKAVPILYKDWQERIEKSKAKDRIRGFVVKVKYFDFKSTTHESSQVRYPSPQDFENLLQKIWEKRAAPVRLLGLGTRFISSKPTSSRQLSFKF